MWLWWWVGIGAAVRLVGWQRYPDQVVDMLSVSSGEEAALTRVYPSGEVHVHQPGRLVEVLALLAWDPR